jgi:carbonic anhydrase
MDDIIDTLKKGNSRYIERFKDELQNHVKGQSPSIAILTCSDSRVIPEFIFDVSIGKLFIVRVAGNIAMDSSVISSLEYAVDHLHVRYILILAHTHCGAVKASEGTEKTSNPLLLEIKQSFSIYPNDHIKANLTRQLQMLPRRSTIIKGSIEQKKVILIGAIYHLDSGQVEFLS